jgi:hypothetical protein
MYLDIIHGTVRLMVSAAAADADLLREKNTAEWLAGFG